MGWFKRHLNWAWVLIYLSAGVIFSMLIFTSDNSNINTLGTLGVLIFFIVFYGVSAWVIHEKGRSLWWVLLANWLSPLWLGNKNSQEQFATYPLNSQGSTRPVQTSNINQSIQFCAKCGTRFVSDARFCAKCGTEKPIE